MQKDEAEQNCSEKFVNPCHYESDPLLLLQSRQIVHHILIVEDWIILSIETPHQKSIKKNFSKIKQSHHHSSTNQHQSQQMKSITRLVSVMGIRTEDKNIVSIHKQLAKKKKQINSAHELQSPSSKSSIGEIKMLHKQCRLQNIIPWPVPEQNKQKIPNFTKSSVVGNDKNSTINIPDQHKDDHYLPQIKQFILLTYTRIQLYAIQYVSDISSIRLVRIFQTPFVIPFNIVWLKNQKLASNQKYPNHSRQKSHLSAEIKFKSHKNQQPFQIALSGIDRSQTFWSGYYEIENHKRNIYLLRNFMICPKQNSQHIKVLKDFKSPQKKLRRVRSAENVFNFRSPFKGQKNKLTSTQHFTKQSLGFDNQSIAFQNKFQLSSHKQDLNKKLQQFKQTLPYEFISRIEGRGSIKKQQKIQKMIAKELQYDEKLQIYPKLIIESKSSHYHHDKHSLSPGLVHFSHFYLQVSHVSHVGNNSNKSNKRDEQNTKNIWQKRLRFHYELMLIISYHSSMGLINVQRKQLISRVQLQPTMGIVSMSRIQSVFGIFSVVVLLKDMVMMNNNNNSSSSNNNIKQSGSKLIKVTIDGISWDKLGIGLQKLRLQSLISHDDGKYKQQQQQQYQSEQIVQITNIWQESLLDEINQLIDQHQRFMQSHLNKRWQEGQLYQMDKDLIKQSVIQQDTKSKQYQSQQKQQQYKQDIHNNQKIPQSSNDNDNICYDSFISQFQHWRDIPITEVKYNLLLVTSLGRMLLYNHIRNTVKEIYSPYNCFGIKGIKDVNKRKQTNKDTLMSMISTSKLYLHYDQQQYNDIDNIQSSQQPLLIPSLRLKSAAIFNKQVIPETIKHYSHQNNDNRLQQQYALKLTKQTKPTLPIAYLKQLKQIILLNNTHSNN